MKNPKCIFLLSLTAFLFGFLSPLVAQENEGSEKVTLLVVVADSLISNRAYHNELDMYIRIKQKFTKAFEKEEWPVNLKFERWSASIPDDGLQLRIWFKSLEEETFGDLVFLAWVTLLEDGEKTDFKIIKVRTYPRAGRHPQDNVDEILSLAAEEVVKKLNEFKFNKS
jgi:hypothetical protein